VLKDTNLLECLHDLAVDGARGVSVVGGARAAVLGGTIPLVSVFNSSDRKAIVPVGLAKTADTDRLAHVDVAGDGGGADVEPVNVLGRQLLGVYASLDIQPRVASQWEQRTRCLDSINPACRLTVSKLKSSPNYGIQAFLHPLDDWYEPGLRHVSGNSCKSYGAVALTWGAFPASSRRRRRHR
jgi:hypothetical protein